MDGSKKNAQMVTGDCLMVNGNWALQLIHQSLFTIHYFDGVGEVERAFVEASADDGGFGAYFD